jgi:hypothetical protein
MVSFDSCECGWKSQKKDVSSSSRAAVSHMKRCPLRKQKATESSTLSKRGISDSETIGVEDVLLEPPQKIPRLLPVSVNNFKTIQSTK